MSGHLEGDSAEVVLARHATRNFVLNVLDGSAFVFGLNLVSRYTVLPLFIERLSGERWLQGLLPMIVYLGMFVPGLVVAPMVASRPRRKPWVMVATLNERWPLLVLGLLLVFAPGLPSGVLLGAFLVLYTIQALAGGFTIIAWQDFVARLIPGRRWGVFFGLQFGIGGVLGVGGAMVVTMVLAAWPFPQGIGVLALLAFAAMCVSYVLFGLTIEPPQFAAPRQPLDAFLRELLPLLRRDQVFRRYIVCRSAIALGLAGHSFLTAAALEYFHLVDADVGVFTALFVGAQAVGYIVLGVVADRWGHKYVLELATGVGMVALVLAVVAPTAMWFWFIFVLVGVAQAGYQLSGFTLVFSFSPPAERTMYIGVANALLSPVAALGPLLAGWLAQVAGYGFLFGLLVVVGMMGLLGVHWGIPGGRLHSSAADGG